MLSLIPDASHKSLPPHLFPCHDSTMLHHGVGGDTSKVRGRTPAPLRIQLRRQMRGGRMEGRSSSSLDLRTLASLLRWRHMNRESAEKKRLEWAWRDRGLVFSACVASAVDIVLQTIQRRKKGPVPIQLFLTFPPFKSKHTSFRLQDNAQTTHRD